MKYMIINKIPKKTKSIYDISSNDRFVSYLKFGGKYRTTCEVP